MAKYDNEALVFPFSRQNFTPRTNLRNKQVAHNKTDWEQRIQISAWAVNAPPADIKIHVDSLWKLCFLYFKIFIDTPAAFGASQISAMRIFFHLT